MYIKVCNELRSGVLRELTLVLLALDPNHKPEMAIALTPFLAFLNFLPLPSLLLHLLTVPELDALIPSDLTSALATLLTLPSTRPPDPFLFTPTVSAPTEAQREILKNIFEALMTAPAELVKQSIATLVERYKRREEIAENERGLMDLAIMLDEQYPGDVGVLCVFMLNVVELKRGEAAFLGADMPHAYIKGGSSLPSHPAVRADKIHRHHRVYGDIRQCRPCRADPQTP